MHIFGLGSTISARILVVTDMHASVLGICILIMGSTVAAASLARTLCLHADRH
jgi:hypothetical protein